jgi:hypothetical protein
VLSEIDNNYEINKAKIISKLKGLEDIEFPVKDKNNLLSGGRIVLLTSSNFQNP